MRHTQRLFDETRQRQQHCATTFGSIARCTTLMRLATRQRVNQRRNAGTQRRHRSRTLSPLYIDLCRFDCYIIIIVIIIIITIIVVVVNTSLRMIAN